MVVDDNGGIIGRFIRSHIWSKQTRSGLTHQGHGIKVTFCKITDRLRISGVYAY